MKTLLLTLCLSLSTLAHADWTVVAEGVSGTIHEITNEHAAVAGASILVWVKQTYPNRDFSIDLRRYDCDHIRYMTHEGFRYDPAGNLIGHYQLPREWRSIAPDMVAGDLRQVACLMREILVRTSQPGTPNQPVQRTKRQKYQDM